MEDGYLGIGKHCRKLIPFGHAKVVLPLQSTTLDKNMNVEAGLKIMNGVS